MPCTTRLLHALVASKLVLHGPGKFLVEDKVKVATGAESVALAIAVAAAVNVTDTKLNGLLACTVGRELGQPIASLANHVVALRLAGIVEDEHHGAVDSIERSGTDNSELALPNRLFDFGRVKVDRKGAAEGEEEQ